MMRLSEVVCLTHKNVLPNTYFEVQLSFTYSLIGNYKFAIQEM